MTYKVFIQILKDDKDNDYDDKLISIVIAIDIDLGGFSLLMFIY